MTKAMAMAKHPNSLKNNIIIYRIILNDLMISKYDGDDGAGQVLRVLSANIINSELQREFNI